MIRILIFALASFVNTLAAIPGVETMPRPTTAIRDPLFNTNRIWVAEDLDLFYHLSQLEADLLASNPDKLNQSRMEYAAIETPLVSNTETNFRTKPFSSSIRVFSSVRTVKCCLPAIPVIPLCPTLSLSGQ